MTTIEHSSPDTAVWNFAKAILHGDDEHRGWLLEAARAFEAGEPLPAVRGSGAPAQCAPTDLARITELRVFEHGGFRATVDGVGGWGSTQFAAIENATANAKKLNASPVTSTHSSPPPVEPSPQGRPSGSGLKDGSGGGEAGPVTSHDRNRA